METELERERRTLARAQRDIAAGTDRLIRQEDMVASLRKTGKDPTEAERLVRVMRGTLLEWQRHQTLIEQRIASLERSVCLLRGKTS